MATAESTAAPQRQLQHGSVLYVDDDELVCGSVLRLLRSAGAVCHVASSHDQAVDLLRAHGSIDLAILDYEMPDGDVAWLVQRLRSVRPGLPLLGTSGADRRADFSRRGVDRFIQKPWQLDELVQSCDSLLSTSDLR